MTEKGNIKEITPTNRNSSKQRDEPIRTLAITWSFFKSRVLRVIAFGFASHWLKNWREIFRPIRAVFKWLSKNQHQSNYSDQSQ